MCGIVGYLDKSGNVNSPVGEILLKMLSAICSRGPDSAGVAVFGESNEPHWVLRIKLGEQGNLEVKGRAVSERLRQFVPVHEYSICSEYLRARVDPIPIRQLLDRMEAMGEGLELVSAGFRLEIVKQVGSPENLERSYGVRSFRGTHGIGHTRLSTESRVDLSHSQPFWARGCADVATVHNGHITNYHKLRRQYEQRGIRFYTENDSEIIGIYLHDQISRGRSFEEALSASLDDFDGSFCYLAASGDSLAFVKDRFALKPLLVAETDRFVALATEEKALRSTIPGSFQVYEPGARKVYLWPVAQGELKEV